jgi:two-component system, NtrC family, sensor kinase
MARNSNAQQLAAENKDLRTRLERAEQSVREILSGESDALFVQGSDGAQLFTLTGADQSYRTLIENMSEGALTLTPQGLILYANRRFAQMLGTPLEKVIGSEIHTWFAPESRQVLQTLLQKAAFANRSEELVLAAADGTEVPVYLSVSRLLLDKMPDAFCMVATDLTEQKRNEVILAAEEFARAILEQAADAIVICDRTGRIIRASKRAQAFCGKNPVGRTFEHAFPLRQLNGTEFRPIGAIDTAHRQSVEARLERGGRGFDLLVSIGHLTDSRDEMLGSVVTLTDITERKRAEEVIRTSEQRLNLALESAHLGVWDVDLIRDTSWRSLHHDHIFGHESSVPDWSLAKALSHMVPEDRDRVTQCFEEAKRTGRLGFECHIIQPDQSRHSILVQGQVYRDVNARPIRMMGTVVDITEQKRSAQALQRSELRYRSLFENMLEGYAYCRAFFEQGRLRDFVYLETNGAFENLTGLKDVVGKNVSDVIPGCLETDRELFDLYGRVALTGRAEKRETYFDALGIWISVAVYSPEREHFIAIFDNITTRKLAEKALSKSEEEFRTLADSMPQIVWITRADGWTVYFNQQWMDYTGLTLEESLDLGWNKPIHPDDQKAAWEAWQKATATAGIYSIESRLRRADGTYRWWLVRGVPLKDAAGNIVKWFGTCTDIDDMKVAERDILDSREMFRHIVESTNAIPFKLDLTQGCFAYVGAQGISNWGIPESQWKEPGALDAILPRASNPELRKHFDECQSGPFEFVSAMSLLNNSQSEVRWTGTCEMVAKTKTLRGLMLDITELRRLGRQLQAAQKLESVGRLAAGVAHEINTPVQFVSDNVQFVSKSMSDIAVVIQAYRDLLSAVKSLDDVAAAAHAADEAEKSADLDYLMQQAPLALESSVEGLRRIATIVRSMKEFAHPDGAQKTMADLNQAIRSTLVVARHEYKYVAELDVEFADLPPVMCHLGEVNQVILNLLVNAAHAIADVVKGTDNLGKLTVRTRLDGDAVEISIADTGTGIPEDARDKIFDPFFTTKEVGKGTGQGLALAHSVIVQRHGGTLRFETKCGNGSTFFIRLPTNGTIDSQALASPKAS